MSKEDLFEANTKSKVVFIKPRPRSLSKSNGVNMKENPDSARNEAGSTPLGATWATPTANLSATSTATSYSYLNNPRANFGSEVPHTLKADADRLNASPTPLSVVPPNRTSSTSMIERISYPYKLLRKYLANYLPTTFNISHTSESLNGKRDVGTLAQTISLVLNGQNISEETNSGSLKNFLEVPSSIESLKGSNGIQSQSSDSDGCRKQAVDDVGLISKVPPSVLVEMLYPRHPADGKEKYVDTKAETKPKKATKNREEMSSPRQNITPETSDNSASSSPSYHGSLLTHSSKSTNLFEVISKHVLSITSPGQSFDGNHASLPRFQNQTSPMFTDSMFLRGRGSSDSSISMVENSLTLSLSEETQNDFPYELSSFDTSLGENDDDNVAAANVKNDLVRGKVSNNITVFELPAQMSLQNIFDEQYLSGKKRHSFYSPSVKEQPSDGIDSINYYMNSDSNEQLVPEKSGSDNDSSLSSNVTIMAKQTNDHLTSRTSSDSLENVKTESASGQDVQSLPTQLSLHNLFDEEYLTGKRKHSFISNISKGHFKSDDDTTINNPQNTNDDVIKKETRNERKGENMNTLELPSLMSKRATDVNEKGASKSQPMGPNHIHFDDEVQDGDGKGNSKIRPLVSDRIYFDDSIEDVTGESFHESKLVSPSVQGIRSVMSIHGLPMDQNSNDKGQIKSQPSGSIRINFDDSVVDVISESGRGRKGESAREKGATKAQPLGSNRIRFDDDVQDGDGKGNTKTHPLVSDRIYFDDSIEEVTGESIRESKLVSPSVQGIHSVMSIHGLPMDQNSNDKGQTKTQPSGSIRINFDDSVVDVTSESGRGRKGESAREKGATKAQLSGSNRIRFDDEVHDGDEKGKTKTHPLVSDHIYFDDSIEEVTVSESGRERKGESVSAHELLSLMSEHGLLDEKNVKGNVKTKAQPSSIRINFDDSVEDITVSEYGRERNGKSSSAHELLTLMSEHGLLNENEKNVKGNVKTKAQPSSIPINFDDSINDITNKHGPESKAVKGPHVQNLHAMMPLDGRLHDKDIPRVKTKPPLESRSEDDMSIEELESKIRMLERCIIKANTKQNKNERSDTKGDDINVVLKQQDENLFTINFVEQKSPESDISSGRKFDGNQQDTSLTVEPNYMTSINTDSITTRGNNSFINFDSENPQQSVSKYMIEEAGRYPLNASKKKLKGNNTDGDEKLMIENRKSSRDLHSMLNAEILHASDTSWRDLPIMVYPSMLKSEDAVYGMSADSIDDAEAESSQSQGLPDDPNSPDKYFPENSWSSSVVFSEKATRERSIDELGSESEDNVRNSSSLTNCSIAATTMSSDNDMTGSDEEGNTDSDSLDNEFDSKFKFSRLGFPTMEPSDDSQRRVETSDTSREESASEITEATSVGDDGTMGSLTSEDARLLKFLTTGSVKSSDIDEKLSEAHGHSKHAFKKYETSTNEANLNLGTKSSGHMPKPHEMLSIYSRGACALSNVVNAKSSPSLNKKIVKAAVRWNEDALGDDEASLSTVVVETPPPNKNCGRSVSFSEERQEFPWRSADALSSPMSVTPAHVETTSPLTTDASRESNLVHPEERGDKNETSSTSATGNTTTEDTNKEDDNTAVQRNGAEERDKNAPKKNAAGEEATGKQQQAAAKRRSNSVDDGGGKRAKSQQKVDEEPKRSNSDDTNDRSVFSLDNILPYMRLFFTPAMDEVALDMLHILRGDPGCELCPMRRQEDEAQGRVVPAQEGSESGDEERAREQDEKAQPQQKKDEGDTRQSKNKEEQSKEDNDRQKSSRKDEEENAEEDKDQRQTSSNKNQDEKVEREKEKDEDGKSHQEDEENKEKDVDGSGRVEQQPTETKNDDTD